MNVKMGTRYAHGNPNASVDGGLITCKQTLRHHQDPDGTTKKFTGSHMLESTPTNFEDSILERANNYTAENDQGNTMLLKESNNNYINQESNITQTESQVAILQLKKAMHGDNARVNNKRY